MLLKFAKLNRVFMKKIIIFFIFVLAQIPTLNAQDLVFFRVGSGAENGTYFFIGGEIASIISNPPGSHPCKKGGNCGIPGLVSIVQSTSGSSENIELVNAGLLDAGLVQSNISYFAFNGLGSYNDTDQKYDNIRSVIRLLRENIHIIVLNDSTIQKIEDLKGKRISIGNEGSGTAFEAKVILQNYNISPSEYMPIYQKPNKAVDHLAKGKVDALFFVGAAPVPLISELAERTEIRLLEIDDNRAEQLMEDLHFYDRDIIPANTYLNTNQVKTISSGALLITHKNTPESLIYEITNLLVTPPKASKEAYKTQILKIDQEHPPLDYSVPLHAGAEKFYRDQGIISDARK
jgi:TRAP transporter TAXI family solute receptor